MGRQEKQEAEAKAKHNFYLTSKQHAALQEET
jgi:hypothetical protein